MKTTKLPKELEDIIDELVLSHILRIIKENEEKVRQELCEDMRL